MNSKFAQSSKARDRLSVSFHLRSQTFIFKNVIKILPIFLAGFFLQLAYYLLLFLKLPRYKAEKNSLSPLPVSVIICAKNEAANLDKFLPRVLEQDYPDFELIVVNDCSTDHTEELLAEIGLPDTPSTRVHDSNVTLEEFAERCWENKGNGCKKSQ